MVLRKTKMTVNATNQKPVPAVRPPYLFGWALAAGLLFNWLKPLSLFRTRPPGIVFGLALMAVGVGLLLWTTRTLLRSGVNPRFKPVGSMVTSGPFVFARNPMYISFALVYLGIAFAANALWPILFLPPVIAILHYGVIRREEKYLEERFGDEYRKYKAGVRRWF